jgi:hypothetical protein
MFRPIVLKTYRQKIKQVEDVATKLAGLAQGFLLVATLLSIDQ